MVIGLCMQMDGADVRGNTISGQTDFGFPDGRGPGQSFRAGIAVYDFDAKSAKATGNMADLNKLSGDDIDIDTAFTGTNEIKHNTGTTPSAL